MNKTYKYLRFEELEAKTKTKQFVVKNKLLDFALGYVKWNAQWRRYCFFTTTRGLIFDSGCLADIQDFIDQLMKDWRDVKKLTLLKHGVDISSIEGM